MNQLLLELSTFQVAIRIFLAIIIGGAIGYDRGNKNRPAGFRTHILVCLGAATVSLIQDQLRVSTLNFIILHPEFSEHLKSDLGRIGAQVISGIGFLGAGTIIRDRGSVKGLTTAASIWITGCIGLAIGWGFYTISLLALLGTSLTLIALKKLETHLINHSTILTLEVDFLKNLDIKNLESYILETNIKVTGLKKNNDSNSLIYTLTLPNDTQKYEFLDKFSNLDFIKEINIIN